MDRKTKQTKAEQALYAAVVAAVTGTLVQVAKYRDKPPLVAVIARQHGLEAVRAMRNNRS
jgi:hypothetical protein